MHSTSASTSLQAVFYLLIHLHRNDESGLHNSQDSLKAIFCCYPFLCICERQHRPEQEQHRLVFFATAVIVVQPTLRPLKQKVHLVQRSPDFLKCILAGTGQ